MMSSAAQPAHLDAAFCFLWCTLLKPPAVQAFVFAFGYHLVEQKKKILPSFNETAIFIIVYHIQL